MLPAFPSSFETRILSFKSLRNTHVDLTLDQERPSESLGIFNMELFAITRLHSRSVIYQSLCQAPSWTPLLAFSAWHFQFSLIRACLVLKPTYVVHTSGLPRSPRHLLHITSISVGKELYRRLSVAMIRTRWRDGGSLEKSLAGLTVPEGECIMTGKRGDMWLEQEAERSPLQSHVENGENKLEVGWGHILSKPDTSDIFPPGSLRIPASSHPQTTPPKGDQVFKYMSLWRTFSMQPPLSSRVPTLVGCWRGSGCWNIKGVFIL